MKLHNVSLIVDGQVVMGLICLFYCNRTSHPHIDSGLSNNIFLSRHNPKKFNTFILSIFMLSFLSLMWI